MGVDPPGADNETARHAFGWEPMPPPPSTTLPSVQAGPVLAAWWPRAAALVLDTLVLVAVGTVIAVGAILATGTDDVRDVELIVYAIGIPLSLAYAPLLMTRRGARNGQTLGKQAMSIRVVRENGAPVTLGNALLRELIGRQLPTALTLVYAPVDYLWPLWDRRNQALHDKVAKTFVVIDAPGMAGPSAPGDEPVAGWLPPRAGA